MCLAKRLAQRYYYFMNLAVLYAHLAEEMELQSQSR